MIAMVNNNHIQSGVTSLSLSRARTFVCTRVNSSSRDIRESKKASELRRVLMLARNEAVAWHRTTKFNSTPPES